MIRLSNARPELAEIGVRSLNLFGSVVRGEAGPQTATSTSSSSSTGPLASSFLSGPTTARGDPRVSRRSGHARQGEAAVARAHPRRGGPCHAGSGVFASRTCFRRPAASAGTSRAMTSPRPRRTSSRWMRSPDASGSSARPRRECRVMSSRPIRTYRGSRCAGCGTSSCTTTSAWPARQRELDVSSPTTRPSAPRELVSAELAAMEEVWIGRTGSRQILGTMTDFGLMLESYRSPGRSLGDVALLLAQAPLQPQRHGATDGRRDPVAQLYGIAERTPGERRTSPGLRDGGPRHRPSHCRRNLQEARMFLLHDCSPTMIGPRDSSRVAGLLH